MSNYRQTMELIGELYSYPDMDAVLFPLGLAETVRVSEAAGLPPVGDPLSLLWHVFRLGAPLCALFNQLVNTGPNSSKNSTGQNSSSKDGNTKNTSSPAKSSNNNNSNNSNIQMLEVPTVSLAVGLPYTNVSKKCVYAFLVALKTEGLEADFGISDVYRDDIAGFARVMHAVQKLVETTRSRGLSPPKRVFPLAIRALPEEPTDNRSRLVCELLTTERTYIAGLAALNEYRLTLLASNAISKETVFAIFSNVSDLIEFQRRFLIALEAAASLPANEQRLGAVFAANAKGFDVYVPICSNYATAILILVDNQELLLKIVPAIDPVRQLQSWLILPIQRICRYPMLLKELIKLTNSEVYPYYDELLKSLAIIKLKTDLVNEAQRMEENNQMKRKMMEKIDDWKGINTSNIGKLMLYDKFHLLQQRPDNAEMQVYLFEHMLLCCKETSIHSPANPGTPKLKKKTSKDDESFLQIKGNIFLVSIAEVKTVNDAETGVFEMKVIWNDLANESVTFKCRNQEQMSLWVSRIDSCIHKARAELSARTSGESPKNYTRRSIIDHRDNGEAQRFLNMEPGIRKANSGENLRMETHRTGLVATPIKTSFSSHLLSSMFDGAALHSPSSKMGRHDPGRMSKNESAKSPEASRVEISAPTGFRTLESGSVKMNPLVERHTMQSFPSLVSESEQGKAHLLKSKTEIETDLARSHLPKTRMESEAEHGKNPVLKSRTEIEADMARSHLPKTRMDIEAENGKSLLMKTRTEIEIEQAKGLSNKNRIDLKTPENLGSGNAGGENDNKNKLPDLRTRNLSNPAIDDKTSVKPVDDFKDTLRNRPPHRLRELGGSFQAQSAITATSPVLTAPHKAADSHHTKTASYSEIFKAEANKVEHTIVATTLSLKPIVVIDASKDKLESNATSLVGKPIIGAKVEHGLVSDKCEDSLENVVRKPVIGTKVEHGLAADQLGEISATVLRKPTIGTKVEHGLPNDKFLPTDKFEDSLENVVRKPEIGTKIDHGLAADQFGDISATLLRKPTIGTKEPTLVVDKLEYECANLGRNPTIGSKVERTLASDNFEDSTTTTIGTDANKFEYTPTTISRKVTAGTDANKGETEGADSAPTIGWKPAVGNAPAVLAKAIPPPLAAKPVSLSANSLHSKIPGSGHVGAPKRPTSLLAHAQQRQIISTVGSPPSIGLPAPPRPNYPLPSLPADDNDSSVSNKETSVVTSSRTSSLVEGRVDLGVVGESSGNSFASAVSKLTELQDMLLEDADAEVDIDDDGSRGAVSKLTELQDMLLEDADVEGDIDGDADESGESAFDKLNGLQTQLAGIIDSGATSPPRSEPNAADQSGPGENINNSTVSLAGTASNTQISDEFMNETAESRAPKPSKGPSLKIKAHFCGDIFILSIPHSDLNYTDLVDKVGVKIQSSGVQVPALFKFRLKYRDEDGDLVRINGQDDLELAVETNSEKTSLMIYIDAP